VRSSDNPALDVLSRASDPARTALGSSKAPSLTPATGGSKALLPLRAARGKVPKADGGALCNPRNRM